MKPRIFIGSSTENLKIAEYIQSNLEYDSYPEIWTQNIFQLSESSIESLFYELLNVDFAIFVLSPDDIVKIRDEQKAVARDNVVFELGLFMGRLGKDRVFYIIPRNVDIHLPTDLLGHKPGSYDPNHPNLSASLGPFCTQIKQKISDLFKPKFASNSYFGPNVLFPDTTEIQAELDYCFEATTPHSFELKIVLRNHSMNPPDNGWGMSLGKSDGWIFETYDMKSHYQVFRLSENKNSRMQILFRGEGSATLEYYIKDQLFDKKDIYWK